MAGDRFGNGEPALVLTLPNQATASDDGLLNASEIAQLKMDAELVILSACDTAAGGADSDALGLSGLARAFFSAGTRSLLVSNWPVISEAAKDITTSMFQNIEPDQPTNHADALQQAILQVMANAKNDLERHPVYWAPFVVIGE
jgi:CHAT domain-containing protein